MRLLVHDLAAARLPEIDRVLDQPGDAAFDQCGFPVAGNTFCCSRKRASSAQEAPSARRRNTSAPPRPPARPAPAGHPRRADSRPAAAPRYARHGRPPPLDRRRPALLDPLQLQLRDQGQDPDREPAHRRRPIEVVLHRHQPRPGLVQPLDRLQRINRRTRKPIQPRNHDPARLAPLTPRQAPPGTSAAQASHPTGRSLPTTDDLDPMQLRPALDLRPLHLRRNKRLALTTPTPRHPHIAISRPCFTHTQNLMPQLDVRKLSGRLPHRADRPIRCIGQPGRLVDPQAADQRHRTDSPAGARGPRGRVRRR